MNKICTSIEQSKKLIELGIDANTTDMIYTTFYGKVSKSLPMPKEVYEYFKCSIDGDKCVPAWSLSALLEIMPKLERIGYEKSYPKIIRHNFTNKFYGHCLYYDTDMFDKPIDAAFEMVCWLLENKKI